MILIMMIHIFNVNTYQQQFNPHKHNTQTLYIPCDMLQQFIRPPSGSGPKHITNRSMLQKWPPLHSICACILCLKMVKLMTKTCHRVKVLCLCGFDCYWLTGTTGWCHPNWFILTFHNANLQWHMLLCVMLLLTWLFDCNMSGVSKMLSWQLPYFDGHQKTKN
jgi:hypothetical protein